MSDYTDVAPLLQQSFHNRKEATYSPSQIVICQGWQFALEADLSRPEPKGYADIGLLGRSPFFIQFYLLTQQRLAIL